MNALNCIKKEIIIPGLQKSYRILHVTDVHVTLWDDRDEHTVIADGAHKGKRLVLDFGVKRAKHFTADGISTNDKFTILCDCLKEYGASFADAVVFTGDILDFYTDAAFEFMMENLNKLPMPYLFVLGNHDYIFSNHDDDFTFGRFAKLCGGSFQLQKYKLGELTLIGLFNGEYFYDRQTLALFSEAIEEEAHVLVFQHVPINSPSLEAFFAEIGKNNVVIGADNCPSKDDSKDLFMHRIDRPDSPVRALICGDSHYDYSGPLTDQITQYISPLLKDFPPVLFTVKGN